MVQVAGIDHLVLRVSNYEKSKSFYGSLLTFMGFEVLGDYGNMIEWTNKKTRFWIDEADKQRCKYKYRIGDVDFHHYAFELGSRADVDELQAFLTEMKATIVDPAGEYYPNYYAVFFLDPDGMKLEGVKYGKAPSAKKAPKSSENVK